MSHSFIACIDESGDDGLSKFRSPGNQGGASTWLTVSVCLFRHSFELDAVKWRDEIANLAPKKGRRDVHFADMKHHSQKVAAAKLLSSKPIRTASVLSNKTVIPEGIYKEKNQLYFYLTRYLIERISWLCRDLRPQVPQGDGRVKIVFSRRGGMSYRDFRDYLNHLRNMQDCDQVKIHWPVIDIDAIGAKDHSSHAGLQLADIAASAFAASVEPDKYGNCEPRYAQELRPVIYNRNGNYLSYGFKLVPDHSKMALTDEQLRVVNLFKMKRQPPGP